MLKPLIYILIVVILFALGMELNLFDTTNNTLDTKPTKTFSPSQTVTNIPLDDTNQNNKTLNKEVQLDDDDNLSKELKKLVKLATKHFQKTEDSEAFKLYDEVINQSKNSNNPKILKIFAEAIFGKALLNNIYPNNDTDAAIETYDLLIDKFEPSNDAELLRLYIKAKLEQSKLLSKDDLLITYDELINKFEKDKEHRFDKEVEEFLFAKSFALMDDNAEEAMEVLDGIIEKYQKNGNEKLPETVQISILNNIELAIITDNSEDEYVDLANKYLSNDEGTAPLLDMLSIIKNAQDINQEEEIIAWFDKHEGYHFPDWDFNELEKWASNMENKEGQERIAQYLAIFKKYKTNRSYPSPTIYSADANIEEVTEDSNAIVYDTQDEENIYEDSEVEPYIYEPDPYLNDIYEEPTYDNPEYIQYEDPYANTTEPYSSSSENNLYDSPAYTPEY